MKTVAERRLFWFLKDGTELDLENRSHVDLYVQQVLCRGRAEDVRNMLRMLGLARFRDSFKRIRQFLPQEVRRFWEDAPGSTDRPAKDDTDPS